jgi:hypothetical protein
MSQAFAGNRVQEALELPLSYPIKNRFFVRQCYGEYYDEIIRRLEGGIFDYITVTGSPGIGKSVFYLYFFERYRKENREKHIVTAAFSRRYLKNGMVFYPEGANREPEKFYDSIPSIESAIYLYDGAPRVPPPFGQKMVCFPSPNQDWLDCMFKNWKHCTLYMPPWTLEELQEARLSLHESSTCEAKILLTAEEVERRFQEFGGSARYCFTTIPEFNQTGLDHLRRAQLAINSFRDLEDRMNGFGEIPYDLLFMYPVGSTDFVVDFASLYAKQKVEKRIADQLGCTLEETMNLLSRISEGRLLMSARSLADNNGKSRRLEDGSL